MDEMKKQKVWTAAGWAVSVLALLPFIPSAFMKWQRSPEVVQGMAQSGIPVEVLTTIAILETISVVLYLIPQTAVLGAILLAGYLGGAIMTHLRLQQSVLMPAALGVLLWLGLYLRERRLWSLLPLRRPTN